jgi:hypothetical protein
MNKTSFWEKDDLQQDYLETHGRLNYGYVYSIFLLFSAQMIKQPLIGHKRQTGESWPF